MVLAMVLAMGCLHGGDHVWKQRVPVAFRRRRGSGLQRRERVDRIALISRDLLFALTDNVRQAQREPAVARQTGLADGFPTRAPPQVCRPLP